VQLLQRHLRSSRRRERKAPRWEYSEKRKKVRKPFEKRFFVANAFIYEISTQSLHINPNPTIVSYNASVVNIYNDAAQ
jgi:pterin-4a-carbinolamine dehydratase